MNKPPFYVVSDGRLVLHLEPAEEGGYVVTSPFDPALITEAETIEEAFELAEEVTQELAEARTKQERRVRKSFRPRNGSKVTRRKSATRA
jgi:antitoxin HicB